MFCPLHPETLAIEDIDTLTHIISTHIDFPEYNVALDRNKLVVKPSWVWFGVSKGRQVGARQHSPDPGQYFQAVVVSCANLPEGDADAIVAGVLALGGMHSGPMSKLVTHVVTNDMEHDKVRLAIEKNTKAKIVLPHWFDDCLTLGKLINERPYTFPNPEILQPGLGPVRPPSLSAMLDGATTAKPEGEPPTSPPSSPSATRKCLTAFACKRVMISADLDLSKYLLETLGGLIECGGGTMTDDVDEADVFVCHYRDGDDYVRASQAGKEVATLSWLYHVISRNKYTSPQGRLLHYPIPRQGFPGFENMKISISNYTGDTRTFLESLVKACGAEFTKTMKQDNTHLITAHAQSEKCEAAQEWGINIANHLWLEDSYAKCTVQSLTNPKYTRFPERTNLSEVVGQTALDMTRIAQRYFPEVRISPKKVQQSPRKAVRAVTMGAATPLVATQVSAPTPIAEDDEPEDEADEHQLDGDHMEEEPKTNKKARGRPRKSLLNTPRFADDEKENESPLYTGSGRASKMKALSTLQDQAGDIALFEKEMKRKGGVTHGVRRASKSTEAMSSPMPAAVDRRKRKSDENTYDVTAEGSDLSDGETQVKGAKKVKREPAASKVVPANKCQKMIVTSYDRWLGNSGARQESADKTTLRQLGILVTTNPRDSIDILVAPKLLRTLKFVAALASSPLVVDTSYLDYALKHEKLPTKPPVLQDKDAESRNGFKLSDALARAEVNDGNLLRGWTIFVTDAIKGGFKTYQEITEVNGGECLLYKGRSGLKLPRRVRDDPNAGGETQHQGDDDEYDHVYLVSGTTAPEKKCWEMFRKQARDHKLEARVVTSDWLLNAAMSQMVRWDEKWALGEHDA